MPEPVEPTIAVVLPGSADEGDVIENRSLGARVAERDVGELDPADGGNAGAGCRGHGHARLGGEHLAMRSAQTTARGIIMTMKTPIMTEVRIWSRYWRNAVSEPIWISPASTRWPPNQSTAAVARCRIIMMTGNMRTKMLPTLIDTTVMASFARW